MVLGMQASRIQHTGARRLFCIVFGACCNTIILVLFELLGVLTFSFRLLALKAHIAVLVLFMLCAIPWCAPHAACHPPPETASGTASPCCLAHPPRRIASLTNPSTVQQPRPLPMRSGSAPHARCTGLTAGARACSYQIHGLLRSRLTPRTAAIGTLIAQLALMHLLLHVLPPWPGVAEPPAAGLFSLRVAILRTGVLGVCVIAILAGFGTVDFPFRVLRAFVVPVNPYEVQVLQTQLQQVRDQVRACRAAVLWCVPGV